MSTTHVYFADMPLAAAVDREGHSPMDALNDDAIRTKCRSISPNCVTSSPIPRYERNMGFFRQLSRRFGLRSNDDLVFTGSNEDDNQSSSTDSCSSHTPLSAAATMTVGNNKKDNNLVYSTSTATEYISCASSETSSTVDIEEQLLQLQLQQQIKRHVNNSIAGNDEDDDNDEDNDNPADNKEEDNYTVNTGDNNENTDDGAKTAYNKDRKSSARSSFSRLHRRSTTSLRRAFEAFSLSSRSLSCSGVTPPPLLPTSSASASTNNGTPIKSALKSSSNLELNKNSQASSTTITASSCLKKFSFSAGAKSTNTATTLSSSAASSKTKTKPQPQRILRQPVSYTYLKGISGLPTQRVPRNSVCCQYARR